MPKHKQTAQHLNITQKKTIHSQQVVYVNYEKVLFYPLLYPDLDTFCPTTQT